jgi:hypothetical protein
MAMRASVLECDRAAVLTAEQHDRLVADAAREELPADHFVRESCHLPAIP